MLDDIASVPGNFTKENLQHDIDNLYNMGVGLASAGIGNIGDALLQTSSFHELMGGRVSKVIDLYDHYGALFEQAEHDLGGLLISYYESPNELLLCKGFTEKLVSELWDYIEI